MIWTIITVGSLAAFVLIAGYAIFKISGQSKLHPTLFSGPKFIQDSEESKKNIGDYGNRIYKTQNPNSSLYIDYYMISTSAKHMYLKCHFLKPITKNHMVAVRLFNDYRKCVKTLYIKYPKTMENSSLIELPMNSSFVNVEVLESKDEMMQIYDIKSHLLKSYKKWSFVLLGSMIFLYIPLSYSLLSSLVGNQLPSHMNINTFLLGLSMMIVIIMTNLWVIVLWTKSKNRLRGKDYEYNKEDQ